MRFRHAGEEKRKTDPLESLLRTEAFAAVTKAASMMQENGRLSQEFRERLLDMMLLDYLSKIAKGKS